MKDNRRQLAILASFSTLFQFRGAVEPILEINNWQGEGSVPPCIKKATSTIFIVFGMTQSGIKPTIAQSQEGNDYHLYSLWHDPAWDRTRNLSVSGRTLND